MVVYFPDGVTRKTYWLADGKVNKGLLVADILSGSGSPIAIRFRTAYGDSWTSPSALLQARSVGVAMALGLRAAFEEIGGHDGAR